MKLNKISWTLGALLVLSICVAMPLGARTLTGGRGIPVVSDPKDLNLVDMKNLSDYLYTDLKNKGDFGLIRRVALGIKAKELGIPNPRKNPLYAGFVINKGSSGNSSAILVAYGDLKFKDIRDAVEKDYREYMATNKGVPVVSEGDIGGMNFTKFAYSERPYEVCVGQLPGKKIVLWGAVPQGDYSTLEETIRVAKGEEKLNDNLPSEIEAQTSLNITKRESERLANFNRSKGGLRAKFVNGMKGISQQLGLENSETSGSEAKTALDSVSLEAKVRLMLATSEAINVKYHWDLDNKKAAAYNVSYTISMKDPGEAENLRSLISEQVTRLSEKSPRETEKNALGLLTVNDNGSDVNLNFTLDTPEAQFEHISLLVSQLGRYKNMTSFLDRLGIGAKPESAQ